MFASPHAPFSARDCASTSCQTGPPVALVVRDGQTFVPDGDMEFTADDVLLLAVAPDTTPDALIEWATQHP